jgi:hypothetical protein
MKGTLPFFGGRANVERPGEEGMEKTAGRRTGVRVETNSTGSAPKAERALLDMLAASEPVMLQVDMGYLPYFDFPEEYHFGGHVVVAAGYDPETRQVLIADRDEPLHPVLLDDLERARGSQHKPFQPRHTWFTFDFSEKRPPQAEEVWQAVREVSKAMLNPPIANLGVSGIRTAKARIPKWPSSMDLDEVRHACFNIFIFVDATGGSGGGLFRYMYGRFLNEAAAITGEGRLAALGQEIAAIGDRWQEVALAFKAASETADPASSLPALAAPLSAIADCEEAAWRRLAEIAD